MTTTSGAIAAKHVMGIMPDFTTTKTTADLREVVATWHRWGLPVTITAKFERYDGVWGIHPINGTAISIADEQRPDLEGVKDILEAQYHDQLIDMFLMYA